MNHNDHLTEDVRQMMADGSLDAEQAGRAQAHLLSCAACRDDVARITRLLGTARESSPVASHAVLAELWPGIRERIEERKTATLTAPRARSYGGSRLRWIVGIAAVVLVAVALTLVSRTRRQAAQLAAVDTGVALSSVLDSTKMYQEEAKLLLDRLQLQRSMLHPEAVAAIDHELAVVDSAIGELEVAIARDPRDPTLRSLLAMSYRRKVEILTRAENAG